MRCKVSTVLATLESKESRDQVVSRLDGALQGLTWFEPPFRHMNELVLIATVAYPDGETRPRRGIFHKTTQTYCITAMPPDYGIWARPEWQTRIAILLETLHSAIGRIPRTRLDDDERQRLHGLLDKAAEHAIAAPPKRIAIVHPTYSSPSGVRLCQPGETPPPNAVMVPPEGAMALAACQAKARRDAPPDMVKLYKKEGGRRLYREAWIAGDEIVEHWGTCREHGRSSSRALRDGESAKQAFTDFTDRARELGYRLLPPSRQKMMVVQYPVEGFGGLDDLARRHAIEEHLNQMLGWNGLGHVDGGSMGMGTMDIACVVVDRRLAREIIVRSLVAKGYGKPLRIHAGDEL